MSGGQEATRAATAATSQAGGNASTTLHTSTAQRVWPRSKIAHPPSGCAHSAGDGGKQATAMRRPGAANWAAARIQTHLQRGVKAACRSGTSNAPEPGEGG
eukprot:12458384-Alexandrium_andersonii.AAC.1